VSVPKCLGANPGVQFVNINNNMLANTLNTNEIKNTAGTEVEFARRSNPTANATEFVQVNETYNLPHRLSVKHQETGTGKALRRRSLVRFDKTVAGADGNPVKLSGYIVMDIPVGNLSTTTESKNVLAELLSFTGTTGAATTVLFDCTGNGAVCLINGDL